MEEIEPNITVKLIIYGLLVFSSYLVTSWVVHKKLMERIKTRETRNGIVMLVSIIMFCLLIYVVFKP
jgi:uncharacterized membrane protein